MTLSEKEEKTKERLYKIIVTFEVRKVGVDSEVLLGAGRRAEKTQWRGSGLHGTINGGSHLRPRAVGLDGNGVEDVGQTGGLGAQDDGGRVFP